MAEGGFYRSRVFLAALIAAVLPPTGCSHPEDAPDLLLPGSSVEIELERDQSRIFVARVAGGSVFHLEIDQNGADLEIRATANGRELPKVDLPYGSRIREKFYFEAVTETELAISIRSGDGRGKSVLKVGQVGPGEKEGRAYARDFAAFWQCWEQEGEPRLAVLRRLAVEAADPWLRTMAAGAAAKFEPEPGLALRDLELAFRLAPAANEPALAGQFGLWRATVLDQKGERQAALEASGQALAASLTAGDRAAAGVAEALIGNFAWLDNNGEETVRHFSAARNHYEAAGYWGDVRKQELILARSLTRRARSPEALARLLRLLATSDAGPNGDEERAELLREIGWWLHLDDRSAEGRRLLLEAADFDPRPVPTLQRLATLEMQLGDFPTARAILQRALELEPNPVEVDGIESSLCRADLEQGDLAAALVRCEQARSRLEEEGRSGALPGVYHALARIEHRRGNLARAEQYARKACTAIESVRRKAGNLQETLDFLAVRVDPFELLVELRLELHAANPGADWEERALEADEATRGRLLVDLLASDRKSQSQLQAPNREPELHRQLEIRSLGLLASLLHQKTLPAEDIRSLDAPLREIEELRAEPGETGLEAAATPFDLAALTSELEPGALLLVFHLAPEDTGDAGRAFGWALTGRRLRGETLGPATDIRRLAAALHDKLAGSEPRYRRAAERWSARLSEELFAPFAAEIAAARRVVVVAPAELQRVPFGALPFPAGSGQPLIAERAVAALPSAAVLPALRRRAQEARPRSHLLAIVDDPVYDGDPRLPAEARRAGPFSRLPDTALEGQRLYEMAGEAGALRITGFDARRDRLLGGALAGFRILHFATHARTGAAPRGLVLSRFDESGKRITDVFGFHELANLSLDADLVVTSACSSALGELVPGEGLLGLTQGFLSSGVPRLLLTLWPVRGQAARRLVEEFYRQLLAGASPAEALRRAQLKLYLAGDEMREWAAFELYGDWRPLPGFSRVPDKQNAVARVDRERGGTDPRLQR
jgi:CHAT domain-containing protein